MRSQDANRDVQQVKERVDLAELVGRYRDLKRSGTGYKALCPFHDDKTPSLFVDTGKGLWHCFGCGAGGDAISFVERIERVGFKEAVEKLAAEYGLGTRGGRVMVQGSGDANTRTSGNGGLTVEQYSAGKRLPIEFLSGIGVTQLTFRGAQAVRIPYFDADRALRSTRFRVSLEGEDRFRWKKGDRPMPYGLWRLDEARKAGSVTLVEGESDTQTLWFHGFPAIGLPGAGTWRDDWACHFEGVERIDVVIEPDAGGEQVLQWLRTAAIRDRVMLVDLGDSKDPSALYLASPESFSARWQAAIDSAVPWRDRVARAQADGAAQAYDTARDLLHDPCLLDRVRDEIVGGGFVGDTVPAILVYLAATSRLLKRPINLALVAPSAAGKNRAIDAALALLPPECVYEVKACSPKALIYVDESFEHRVVVVAEADSLPDEGAAASAIRSIAEDGCMTYDVTVRDPETGEFAVRRRAKRGPTVLITTSTKSLAHQLGTRLLEIAVPDDEAQTRAILRAQARAAMSGKRAARDIGPFVAVQRWLSLAAETEIAIPYSDVLASLVPARQVRIRRDFNRLLTCIGTIAFLYQCQREKDADGSVIATIADYAEARDLLSNFFGFVATEGLTPAIRETIEAVPMGRHMSLTELAGKLGVSKSTASWRVKRALATGWLVNTEPMRGLPMKLEREGSLPSAIDVLPEPELVRVRFEEEERAIRSSNAVGLPESASPPTAAEGAYDGSMPSPGGTPIPLRPGEAGDTAPARLLRCVGCGALVPCEELDGTRRCPTCTQLDRSPF